MFYCLGAAVIRCRVICSPAFIYEEAWSAPVGLPRQLAVVRSKQQSAIDVKSRACCLRKCVTRAQRVCRRHRLNRLLSQLYFSLQSISPLLYDNMIMTPNLAFSFSLCLFKPEFQSGRSFILIRRNLFPPKETTVSCIWISPRTNAPSLPEVPDKEVKVFAESTN